jgi:RNase P/RNase MRP subunit p29
MKTLGSPVRLIAALAAAAGIAACGGYTTVTLGGSVSGLTVDGLVLANGGNTYAVPANATTYTFPDEIDSRGAYEVTVQSSPAHYTCAVVGGKGTATGVAVSSANVVCGINSYTVGGAVAGLTAGGLVLTNGSDTLTVAANSTTFTMPTKVAYGAVYGIAVLTQPTGQTCTVSNGTAVMGEANVTNIQVTCS